MSANQKPIDAIRREMNKRGYSLGIDKNRRDICDLLGVSKKSSTKRLCGILDVEYNSNHYSQPYHPPITFFLIDIENPLDHIKFETMTTLSNALLFGGKPRPYVLNDIIESQYVVWYNDRQYVISHTSQRELSPKYSSPYMMVTIRQVMRCRGYDVTYETNRKDICAMLDLPSDSTKKKICERLEILYVKTSHYGGRQWRRVILTNPYDPSHVVEFRSILEASRMLNINRQRVYTYAYNPTLTVEYEGDVFSVSFVEEE